MSLANAALDRTPERDRSGTPATWRNCGSGNAGSVTPLRSYRSGNGGSCRDYRDVLIIGNDGEPCTDTACRDAGGKWQPVD